MIIGTVRLEEARALAGSEGYHRLTNGGTVEVFWNDGESYTFQFPGWYWWASLPGCLPDGEPMGPFASSHLALADAEAFEE